MKVLKTLVVAVSVLCLPVAMGGQGILDLGDFGAAHAKNDNKGGGNGGGKSESRGGGRSDKGGKSASAGKSSKSKETASAGGSGKSDKTTKGNPFAKLKNVFGGKKKTAKADAVRKSAANRPAAKVDRKLAKAGAATAGVAVAGGALNSQLKSLNSLNRNINGLMNSSDPKMEPFREFVAASADHEAAVQALESAELALVGSQTAFDQMATDLGLTPDDRDLAAAQLAELVKDHAANEPVEPIEPVKTAENEATYDALHAEWVAAHETWTTEHAAWEERATELGTATQVAEQYAADAATYEAAELREAETALASSEQAMREAMIASLNATGAGPVTDADITPEMEAWVAGRLGVDDADGLIDDYIARQAETETVQPGAEEIGESEL